VTFSFFHSAKITSNGISIEQDLKKLKLKYYKVFNGTTLETINNSVYKISIKLYAELFYL
jgi:hypothetical protein